MPLAPWDETQGAWRGMLDAADPLAQNAERVRLARNVLPLDRDRGTAWIGRPGCTALGGRVSSTGPVQWIGQFTRADANGLVVQHSLAVAGGVLYEYSWGANQWLPRPMGGGLVLDAAALIGVVAFANRLILSDGVHKPIAWDGTAFAELSAAPILYGQPTVYYAKLFGIMAQDRRTIAWSDEADPFNGYTSDQQWTLGQSDTNPLTALVGTNERLYVFRARSITAIGGAVADDFSAAGTREGVSESVGTESPFAVVTRDSRIVFLDADIRPRVITPGGGADDQVWRDVRETMRVVPRVAADRALGVWNAALDVVQLHVREDGASAPSLGLWLHGQDFTPLCVSSGYEATALGELRTAEGRPMVVHGSANGWCYVHDAGAGIVWDDTLAEADGGVRAIMHEVTGAAMGADTRQEKKFDRLDVVLRSDGVLTGVTFELETPYGSDALTENVAVAAGNGVFDLSSWDDAAWASEGTEVRVALGFRMHGRWCVPKVRHAAPGEAFGLMAWTLSGFWLQRPPKAR